MKYNLRITTDAHTPIVTLLGLTHAQLVYEIRRLPHHASWTLRVIDADKPRRPPAPLVCYAWPASPAKTLPVGDAGLRPNGVQPC